MKGLFSAGNGLFGAPNTSSSSSKITITNDVATNATMYPVWVTTASGNQSAYVSSTKLSFNPSSGLLSTAAAPVASSDLANKAYVDTFVSGLTPLTACRVATTAALTATYSNGTAGVGATLTNSGVQAAISIDGVSLSSSDRVLVKNQVAPAQNGVYTVATVGSGAANWVLTRATDFDTSAEMIEGSYTNITAGTSNQGQVWLFTTSQPITVGTTALNFGQFGTFGTMATQNANAVAITGGAIDGTAIGGSTPAAAAVTTLTASGQSNFTGSTLIQKHVTGNTGAAYSMNATDGALFDLTLNSDCTITIAESIAAAQTQFFNAIITQDGTGGHTLAWSGVTWASGVAPSMPTAIGAVLYLSFMAKNGAIIGFAQLQATDSMTLAALTLTTGLTGRTTGSAYSAGYVGEISTSTIAIASATSLSTGTAKTITSIVLSAGLWNINGNIGYIAAAGTLPTILEGSINTTTNAQATSPNGGAYFRNELAYVATSTQICPVGQITVNISTPTTYYLVATATFTVSTLTAYGSITARRMA